jgi:carboxyvinyl-carboxyphosphonate phosphorylmutase
VTVVDAAAFVADFASRAPLAARPDLGEGGNLRPVVDLLVEQVEFADVLVLNKTDLVAPGELARLRAILAGTECRSPASVFDGLSARLARSVGYELGILAGSVASNTTLAAPDLIVLTLTEFADQIRRIQRASDLSLIVDADHGYGNALNVMRTVEECEHAGVSCLSIEDTALPTPFGSAGETFIPIAEGVGKMKAALAARRDPSLVIAGRTSAIRGEGIEGALARLKAYAAAGVDCVFVVGLESLEQLAAIRARAGIGNAHRLISALTPETLVAAALDDFGQFWLARLEGRIQPELPYTVAMPTAYTLLCAAGQGEDVAQLSAYEECVLVVSV